MALVAFFIAKGLRSRPLVSRVAGGITAEIVMIGGYLAFESFLYGFIPSLVNVPANAVQGLAGLIIGLLLVNIFEKHHIVN